MICSSDFAGRLYSKQAINLMLKIEDITFDVSWLQINYATSCRNYLSLKFMIGYIYRSYVYYSKTLIYSLFYRTCCWFINFFNNHRTIFKHFIAVDRHVFLATQTDSSYTSFNRNDPSIFT